MSLQFMFDWEIIENDKITSIPEGVYKYPNVDEIKWDNKLAINRFYQLKDLFQEEPRILDKEEGGLAIWFNISSKVENGIYLRVEILDESYLHEKPMVHSDFLKTTIRYQMNENKIKNISYITNSVMYYGVGGELTSMCGEMEANIATLYVIKQHNEGNLTKTHAREIYNSIVGNAVGEFFKNEKKENMWETGDWSFRDNLEDHLFE